LGDDLAAALTCLRSHIDDPIGLGHDIEVVLDHHRCVACLDQPMQNVNQLSTSAMCRPTVGSSSTYSVCLGFCRGPARTSFADLDSS